MYLPPEDGSFDRWEGEEDRNLPPGVFESINSAYDFWMDLSCNLLYLGLAGFPAVVVIWSLVAGY